MKVRRYQASKVHGYLSFDIAFNPDITFLTGINGSGKTTVVNGISALISPSLSYLAETAYESMQVILDLEDAELTISSRKEGALLTISIGDDVEPLRIPILDVAEVPPTRRVIERDSDYYRDQELRQAAHPVMKRLNDLPTPMFLGLERRTSTLFPGEHTLSAHGVQHRAHNVFSGSFKRSLTEAAQLAERSYGKVQARQRDLTDDLKKGFILSASARGPRGSTVRYTCSERRLHRRFVSP